MALQNFGIYTIRTANSSDSGRQLTKSSDGTLNLADGDTPGNEFMIVHAGNHAGKDAYYIIHSDRDSCICPNSPTDSKGQVMCWPLSEQPNYGTATLWVLAEVSDGKYAIVNEHNNAWMLARWIGGDTAMIIYDTDGSSVINGDVKYWQFVRSSGAYALTPEDLAQDGGHCGNLSNKAQQPPELTDPNNAYSNWAGTPAVTERAYLPCIFVTDKNTTSAPPWVYILEKTTYFHQVDAYNDYSEGAKDRELTDWKQVEYSTGIEQSQTSEFSVTTGIEVSATVGAEVKFVNASVTATASLEMGFTKEFSETITQGVSKTETIQRMSHSLTVLFQADVAFSVKRKDENETLVASWGYRDETTFVRYYPSPSA